MKTRNIMFGALLMAPLFIFGSVSAQGNPAERAAEKAQTRVAQATEETTQTAEERKAKLQERITKRKTDLKLRISAAEKQRLQTRCKNSTGKFNALDGRIKGIETSRTQVYENLVNRLTKLSERLQERNVDTTELDAEITRLQEKITTFQTDLATYKQAVADLKDMGADCATDPEGFKASLETARSALQKVKVDAADIKTFVNDTIKPTLKSIREGIVKEDGESESSTENSQEETNEENSEGTSEGNQ